MSHTRAHTHTHIYVLYLQIWKTTLLKTYEICTHHFVYASFCVIMDQFCIVVHPQILHITYKTVLFLVAFFPRSQIVFFSFVYFFFLSKYYYFYFMRLIHISHNIFIARIHRFHFFSLLVLLILLFVFLFFYETQFSF